MILARVAGNVVATHKDERLKPHRILILQPIDLHGKDTGTSLLAMDRVDAGEGDTVLVHNEGGGARMMFQNDHIPIQASVVAVVDRFVVQRG